MKTSKESLESLRNEYLSEPFSEKDVKKNPIEQFDLWFDEAVKAKVHEPNAMTLATATHDGKPSARVVLLKGFNKEGFIFYTNYDSEKGRAIAAHPEVCLSFFWPSMERQVIIKGLAERLPGEVSDNYFDSRPLGSRLGAMVSPQSKVIDSRAVLEDSLKALEAQAVNDQVKRPSHWGGYLVRPKSIEFWQGRPNRLHDRIRYTLEKDFNWTVERLAP